MTRPNYVAVDTTRTIDNKYGSTTSSCNVSGGGCLIMHNGGVLRYNGSTLAGTSTTNALDSSLTGWRSNRQYNG